MQSRLRDPGCRSSPGAAAPRRAGAPSVLHTPWRPRLQLHAAKDVAKTVKKKGAAQWGAQQASIKRRQGEDREEQQGWRLLDWGAYDRPWDVPWGGGTLAAGMAAWVLSFGVLAFLVVPLGWKQATGVSVLALDPAGQARFALVSEAVEATATAALLGTIAYRHRDTLRDRQLFNFDPAAPLAPPDGWLAWGLIGLAAAPVVVGATAAAVTLGGYETVTAGGKGTVDAVAGMIQMDGPTYVSLLLVTGVLAPLLEEAVFRGFLLTTLTKRLPTWAAVVGSAAAFAAAHLSARDAPVLFALGCLLGWLYVRSRNLLTPVVVHGAWNSSVLTLLFVLAASGVDLQELLKRF